MSRRRLVLALALLPLVAAACDRDAPVTQVVQELQLPSVEEREALAAVREGRALLEADEEAAAAEYLTRAVSLLPDDAEARLLLGVVLTRLDRHGEAVEHLKRAVQLDPQGIRAREHLAETLFALGRLEEATDAYKLWTYMEQENADAWYGLGRVLYLQGIHGLAVDALRQAERLRARDPAIRSELGLALQARGELQKAERKQRDALTRVAGNSRDAAVIWFRLGDVISRQGQEREPEAIDALERAVRLAPGRIHPRLYLYRLLRLAADRPGEEAPARAGRAAEIRDEMVALAGAEHLVLTGAEVPAADVGRDEKALRRRVAAAPAEPAPRVRMGAFLLANGRAAESLAEFEAVVEDPVYGVIARTGLAAAYLRAGRPEEAEAALTAAGAFRDGATAVAVRTAGWLHLVRHDPAAALEAFSRTLAVVPDDPHAQAGRGIARMELGEYAAGITDVAATGWAWEE